MKKIKNQFLLISLSFLLSIATTAQVLDLDIIELKHRTAEEIIPIIQPFLIPEAAVTARDYKLIVKSTPENLEEIRKIIQEVDAGLRQLKITVSIGSYSDQVENKTQAQIMAELKNGNSGLKVDTGQIEDSGTVGAIVRGEAKNDKSKVSTKTQISHSSRKRDKPVQQTVRSTEGQWATIHSGQSIPVIERTRNPDGTVTQTVRYRGATTGFKILPRLQPDNKVALYIRPHQVTVNPDRQENFDIKRMETHVVGELGEWIPLGFMNELSTGQVNNNLGSSHSRTERNDSVLVKIELAQ